MNIDDIRALARLVADTNLAEIEIEEKGLKIRIQGPRPVEIQPYTNLLPPGMSTQPMHNFQAVPVRETPAPSAAAPAAEAAPAKEEYPSSWKKVESPMVGTFYRSPAPDADSFVDVGDVIKPDTTLCIVEAMKLMNEIKAEMAGTVKKILIENAQPVEYGQPMFLIEPS